MRELQPIIFSHFGSFLHCQLSSLCNQLLLHVTKNVFQHLQTYCGHIEDAHESF